MRPTPAGGLAQPGGILLTGLGLVTLCLLGRLPAAILFGAEVGDLPGYRAMGEIVLRGENIYHHQMLFPYTPLTLPLPAASLRFAYATGIPFHLAIKVWPIAADCALAVLVWQAARRQGWAARAALVAGGIYALNPVAILTSAFHGNFITVGVLFAFWAYYYTTGPPAQRRYGRAALLLGLGIATRSFPLLLLPVFVILLPLGEDRAGLRRRAAFGLLALVPAALVSVPALLIDAPAYLREVLSYSGFTDQGWLAIRRALGMVLGTGGPEPVAAPPTIALLQVSKVLFGALYAGLLGLLVWRRRVTTLVGGCLLAWLLFYAVYGGVSTHYLVWVLPFGLVHTRRWTLAYTLAAAAGMIGFYLTWFPAILVGPYAPTPPLPWTGGEWRLYLAGLIAAWLVSLAWLGREVRRLRSRPGQ